MIQALFVLALVYEVEGRQFHLLGLFDSCRPALTYSNMSKKYFQSMTLVSP